MSNFVDRGENTLYFYVKHNLSNKSGRNFLTRVTNGDVDIDNIDDPLSLIEGGHGYRDALLYFRDGKESSDMAGVLKS